MASKSVPFSDVFLIKSVSLVVFLLGHQSTIGITYDRRSESNPISDRHSSSAVSDPKFEYQYEQGYVSDWDTDSDWTKLSSRLGHPKCLDIPSNLTLCKDIGYTQMRLPNLLNHDSVREVTQQAASWVPLLNIRCHPDTKLFLCSLFSPICLDRPIWPCRSLCQAVKSGCEVKMTSYGYPWPEMLRCDKFPVDNDLCIGPQGKDKNTDSNVCEVCEKPDTLEVAVDSYCSADFVVRVELQQEQIIGNDLRITAGNKKRKVYKAENLTAEDRRSMQLYVAGGAQCQCKAISKKGDRIGGTATAPEKYIIMGRKGQQGGAGNKLMVTYLKSFSRRSKSIKDALRAVRKGGNVCGKGLKVADLEAVTDGGVATRDKGREKGRHRAMTTPGSRQVSEKQKITWTKGVEVPLKKQPAGKHQGNKAETESARKAQSNKATTVSVESTTKRPVKSRQETTGPKRKENSGAERKKDGKLGSDVSAM